MNEWSEKDKTLMSFVIRFNSLCMGENLGRLTSDEQIELDKFSVVDLLRLGKPREMVGMRSSYFPL
jgi:hypothetical protein